jgi:hypothetical protein
MIGLWLGSARLVLGLLHVSLILTETAANTGMPFSWWMKQNLIMTLKTSSWNSILSLLAHSFGQSRSHNQDQSDWIGGRGRGGGGTGEWGVGFYATVMQSTKASLGAQGEGHLIG